MTKLNVFKTLTGKYQLTGQCVFCNKNVCVTVEAQEYFNWTQLGKHVQDAFPTLSENDREFLISRICGTCFDGMFENAEENRAESIAESKATKEKE
jgi:hypothetical protein